LELDYSVATGGQVVRAFEREPLHQCYTNEVFSFPSFPWETRLWLNRLGGTNLLNWCYSSSFPMSC